VRIFRALAALWLPALLASAHAAVLTVPVPYAKIQDAINAAAVSGDTVVIDSVASPYMGPGNIDLSFEGKEVVVQSLDPLLPQVRDATVIDAADTSRIALIDQGEGPGAKLRGLTLRNGGSRTSGPFAGSGGALLCVGTRPAVENCKIVNSQAWDGGGAACVDGASVKLIDCLIHANSAEEELNGTGRGGAVYASQSSVVELRRCTLEQNDAERNGGAVFADGQSRLVVIQSTLTGNHAGNDGGAIAALNVAQLRVLKSQIRNNDAARFGGGLRVHGNFYPIISACEIQLNDAGDTGGGMYLTKASGIVRFSNFINNEAERGGGGLHAGQSNVTLLRCQILRNELTSNAVANGGGIQFVGGAPQVVASRIGINTAQSGGGVAALAQSKPTLVSCIIDSNIVLLLDEAAGAGGGVLAADSSPILSHCTLVHNEMTIAGGALYVEGASSTVEVHNSILYFNDGNQIDVAAGSVTVDYTDVEGGYTGFGNIDVEPTWEGNFLPDFKYIPDVMAAVVDSADPGDPDDYIDWCGFADTFGIELWCTDSDTNTCAPDMGAYGGQEAEWWMKGTPGQILDPCGMSMSPLSAMIDVDEVKPEPDPVPPVPLAALHRRPDEDRDRPGAGRQEAR